jgi:hypothetical protein
MKKALIVIASLILVYLLACALLPGNSTLERSVVAGTKASTAFLYLGDYQNFHDHWSPWTKLEPRMKTSYTGQPNTTGHHYEWEGTTDEVGAGSMIIDSINNGTIYQTISFTKPFQSSSQTWFNSKTHGDSCKITWGMAYYTPFFIRPVMRLINMEKEITKSFDQGLSNLKNQLETQP